MEKTCPQCENYANGYCRLVWKLAHEYRNVEEAAGGCGARARFFVQYQDYKQRDFENYPAKAEGWR